MTPDLIVLVELLVVLGIVLGLAGWQLVSLRREKRRSLKTGQPSDPAGRP